MSKETAKAEMSSLGADRFLLTGVLDFYTVPELAKQADRVMRQSNNASVDLSAVEKTNSAGLALLLEIVRFMRLRNATVQFNNIPEQIAIVARAYGIDTALDATDFVQQVSV